MDKLDRIKQLYGTKKKTEKKVEPLKGHISDTLPEIEIPGLARPLFPYQYKGVAFLHYKKGRAILGDDMGLGKTAQALAYLQLCVEERPALVICPATLKLNWAKEVFIWMERREENRVFVLYGKGSNKQVFEIGMMGNGKLTLNPIRRRPNTGIIIVNYDVLSNKEIESGTFDQKGKAILNEVPFSGWIDYLRKMVKIVICDEAQNFKTTGALRTKAIKKLGKIRKFIPITGTLIENRPIECYNAIHIVDPLLFPSSWKFNMRYCGATHNGFGWDFSGASNMIELHNKLQHIMIRRKKSEVLKELPEKIRSIIPVELTNKGAYITAERDFIAWIKANKGVVTANKAKNAEALQRIETLKQICLQGKIDACIDWIADYIDSGEKLVVFTTHNYAINLIMKKFKKVAVKIDGSVTGIKRDLAVEEFQKNKKITLLAGNLKAAGTGLTLTAAAATATIELGWTPGGHNQAEDRVHRIGQKADCVYAYYLLAQGTIEEEIAELIDEKRKIVAAVLDGEEVQKKHLLTELLKKYSE